MASHMSGGRTPANSRFTASHFSSGIGNKVLLAKSRNALHKGTFALPGRRYPIPDAAHARNALARVAQNGTPAEQAKVKAAVKKKFPSIGA